MRSNPHPAFKCFCLFGLLISLVAMLSLRPLGAQTVYGSVNGTVLDQSGAVIVNASVEIKSQEKETLFKAQTNSVGQYRIDHLVPDIYDVTISATGFKSFTVKSLPVNAGDSPKVDANLEVGGLNESVTVNATVEELLKTETQDVSLSIPQEMVQELPLVGRSVNNLILLTPGAYAALGQMGVQALNPAAGSTYTVNGQPVGGVNYTLDGTDNTGPILGYIIINPAPNSVQEARTITSSYNADTGRATSAVFATQTRSGTNSFHGLFSDVRTSGANRARDSYVAAQAPPGGPAPALSNQPEFNIGGPILKQRLFFFFDYFGRRERQGSSVTTTLPTAHVEKTCLGTESTSTGVPGCDFGEYLALGDSGKIYDPNGNAYPNNIIPAAELSQQALNLLAMLPPPNIPGSLFNNHSVNSTSPINTDMFTTRIDGQLNSKMHVFGRWTYYLNDLIGYPIFGLAGGPTGGGLGEAGHGWGRTHSLSVGFDDAISSHLLMELRFGYYYDHLTDDMANPDYNLGTELGIPGLNDTGAPLSDGSPVFNINNTVGNQSIGATRLGGSPSTPVRQIEDQFQVTNNWTMIMGTHTLRAGMDLRYGRENRQESFDSRTGNMTFGNGPTSNNGVGGLGWATFIVGKPTSFMRDVAAVGEPKEAQKRTFFYAQDTWRATQKLTINYGLRWEIYFPETVDAKGNGALLNIDTGMLQVAGYGAFGLNMGQTTNFTNFGPRLGLSYQLNSKTVIRAGYGRSYAQANYGSIFGQVPVENPPVYGIQNLSATTPTGYVFNLSEGPPGFVFPTVPSSGLVPVPAGVSPTARAGPRMVLPSLDSWNASFQRAITSTLTVTATYSGNKGTHTYLGNWMYAFPNSPQAVLPASQSITGTTLYYDPFAPSVPDASGHTSNITYLRPLFAKFGWSQDIYYNCNCGDTHFHALQISAEKQYSHGLSITANFAYQKAKNYDAANFFVDKKVTYGPTDMNFDKVFTAYGFYKLPFGREGDFFRDVPKWVDALIGGYQLSPSINISSGQHFSLTYTLCSMVLPQIPSIRAENAAQPCYPNQNGAFEMKLKRDPVTGQMKYFDALPMMFPGGPAQGPFSVPALGTIGNSGRNRFVGPSTWNADIALTKTVKIHENVSAQFRVDAYNAFNHTTASAPSPFYTQFGVPAFIDNPIAGVVFNRALGTTPRQLAFGFKIEF